MQKKKKEKKIHITPLIKYVYLFVLFQKDFINMASVGAGCDDMPPYVSIQNFTDGWGKVLVSFA